MLKLKSTSRTLFVKCFNYGFVSFAICIRLFSSFDLPLCNFLVYVATLFVNFIVCLVSLAEGVENGAGMVFYSIVTIFIFTPLSFLFWFRPLYKAFR